MVPGIDSFRENLKITQIVIRLLAALPAIFCFQKQI